MSDKPLSGRARDIARAAVEVLGNKGAAGLTHRAVDKHAGLPEGSTSNHFRTRSALTVAVCRFLTEHDLARFEQASQQFTSRDAVTLEQAVKGLEAIITNWTGPEATYTAARLELFLIAHRDPDVAAQLAEVRRTFHARTEEWLEQLSVGAGRHARLLMACAEGLTSNQLLHSEERMSPAELRRSLELILDSLRAS